MCTASPSSAARDPTSPESEGLELGLAHRTHRAKRFEVGQGPIGLGPSALEELGLAWTVVFGLRDLVEEQTKRVERIVQLVEDGRSQHPDGLVALDALQPNS